MNHHARQDKPTAAQGFGSEEYEPQPWWSFTVPETLERLSSSLDGLAEDEARNRLERYGPNAIRVEELGMVLAVVVLNAVIGFVQEYRAPTGDVFAVASTVIIGGELDKAWQRRRGRGSR